MDIIHCRIKRSYWWLLLLATPLCGLEIYAPFGMAQDQNGGTNWFAAVFFSCGALGFSFLWIYLLASLLREEVIADEAGLRWRGALGGWKSAHWNEISDFYLSGTAAKIETPRGKFALSEELANRDAMMTAIAARAVNAPAREWEKEKYRAARDFIKRFSYWTNSRGWTAPVFTAYCFGSLLAMFLLRNMDSKSSAAASLALDRSWALFWMPLLLGILLVGMFGTLFAAIFWMMWRDRKRAFARRDEHLEISPRGVAWQRGQKRIEARWDEIRAISAAPNGFLSRRDYRIETCNGDFVVDHALESIELWLQLVRQFAPQIAPLPLESRREFGGEISTWSGGEIGRGARVFHFRTSESRFVLLMATIFLPLLWGVFLWLALMPNADGEPAPLPWTQWILTLIFLVAALFCGWFCFARAAIWADESGLEWRIPIWKTRRVNWDEIERFGHDESGDWIITGAKKHRLWLFAPPVRRGELRELIAGRATNATGRFD